MPIPFGVEFIIAVPPVASVCCEDAQIPSISSIKAASSMISSESASERAESAAADTAFICDPFLKRSDNLLSS